MKVTQTELEGVVVIEPEVFDDNRGWVFINYIIIFWPAIGNIKSLNYLI